MYTAVTAMQKADLLVAIGARFDDRVTGQLATFAPDAKIVHVDIDPAEIGKNRVADVPIVGDYKDVTAKLLAEVTRRRTKPGCPIAAPGSSSSPTGRRSIRSVTTSSRRAAEGAVCDRTASNTPATTRSSSPAWASIKMWASQFWSFEKPRTWINSGGLGTMGFAVPAALGAAAGQPGPPRDRDRRRRLLPDDQPGARDLDDEEKIPFVTAIINNAYLGMVRQWQELFYEALLQVHLTYDVPDYVKLAEAYGAVGLRAERPEEVDAVIEKALAVDDRSVVIDFRCDEREMCFPMVPAGASNDDIITGPEGLQSQADPRGADRRASTISVLVEDKPGVLTRVAGLFSARGSTSTRSRSARPSPRPVPDDDRDQRRVKPLEQVTKQLNKLINVIKILEHDAGSAVERELMLLGRARGDARARIMEVTEVFRVSIVDVRRRRSRSRHRQAGEAGGAPRAAGRVRDRRAVADRTDRALPRRAGDQAEGPACREGRGRRGPTRLDRGRRLTPEGPLWGRREGTPRGDEDGNDLSRGRHRRIRAGRPEDRGARLRIAGARARAEPEGLGHDVRVGLRAGSSSREKAEEAGLTVMDTADAVAEADVTMVLLPDTAHARSTRTRSPPI